jgi:hypothetical protein
MVSSTIHSTQYTASTATRSAAASMEGPFTYAEYRKQCNKEAAARCYARNGYSRQQQRTQITDDTAQLIERIRAAPVPAAPTERRWDIVALCVEAAAEPDLSADDSAADESGGVFLDGIYYHTHWQDDDGLLWDWLTVKGIQRNADTAQFDLLLQWAGRQANGRLWQDSWEPVGQCNGAWEWMYQHRVLAGRVGAYWEEWLPLITTQWTIIQQNRR